MFLLFFSFSILRRFPKIRLDVMPLLSEDTKTYTYIFFLGSDINVNPRKRRTHPLGHLLLFPFHIMCGLGFFLALNFVVARFGFLVASK